MKVDDEVQLRAKTPGVSAAARRLTSKIKYLNGDQVTLWRPLGGFYSWNVKDLRKVRQASQDSCLPSRPSPAPVSK